MNFEKDLIAFINQEIMDGYGSDLEPLTPLLELRIIDSVSITMLATYIYEKYGIDVPQELFTPEHLQNVRTIARLIEHVQSCQTRSA
jgi:clorobiocin biosynthesis protein CloN5